MQFITLHSQLKHLPVFTVNDIKKIESEFDRRRLFEWQKKGYIQKIRRGYYRFADQILDEKNLFTLANKIYTPSYVSLESALSYYGFIPEGVYSVTNVCSRKTAFFDSPVGSFSYRSLKANLLFGYQVMKSGNSQFSIATPEKAILDYLYLNPSLQKREDFTSLRINLAILRELIDMSTLGKYVAVFASVSLQERANSLLSLIKES